jgi:hypothetical protein
MKKASVIIQGNHDYAVANEDDSKCRSIGRWRACVAETDAGESSPPRPQTISKLSPISLQAAGAPAVYSLISDPQGDPTKAN